MCKFKGSLRHRRTRLNSAKGRQNPCSGLPPVYQDLSTRPDWPVKKAIVDLHANQDEKKFETYFR